MFNNISGGFSQLKLMVFVGLDSLHNFEFRCSLNNPYENAQENKVIPNEKRENAVMSRCFCSNEKTNTVQLYSLLLPSSVLRGEILKCVSALRPRLSVLLYLEAAYAFHCWVEVERFSTQRVTM